MRIEKMSEDVVNLLTCGNQHGYHINLHFDPEHQIGFLSF
jgi:hypothetical protein